MRLKISNEIMKKDYPSLGAIGMSKKYGKQPRYFINRAYVLKIKFIPKLKSKRFCEKCQKEINKYQTNELCKNCSAKKIYLKRGKFTNKNSKFWSDKEVKFLIEKYYYYNKKLLISSLNRSWGSITHKATRLGLKRHPKFMEEGNRKGRLTMKINNPMNDPKIRKKSSNSLKKLYMKHPEKLLNARLKRNQMTNIEKKVAHYLDSIGIDYQWNKYVKTINTFRFPDFKIGNLIIECDGLYWHNKTKKKDKERQQELEALGFKVIRFNDKQILKNFEEVKKCIQLELNQ